MNSKLTSVAQSLLVYKAGLLANQANARVSDLVQTLAQEHANIACFVMVNKMDALMRSGRIDKFSGTFANFAHIKPIMRLNQDGRGEMVDKCISNGRALQNLVQQLEREQERRKAAITHYAIVHAGHLEGAQQLAEMAQKRFGQIPLYLAPVSAAIGLHAGHGCVGIAAMFQS